MKAALTHHVYTGDGVVDRLRNVETCTCGLPRRHPRHTMPVVAREVVEAEARRQGERT